MPNVYDLIHMLENKCKNWLAETQVAAHRGDSSDAKRMKRSSPNDLTDGWVQLSAFKQARMSAEESLNLSSTHGNPGLNDEHGEANYPKQVNQQVGNTDISLISGGSEASQYNCQSDVDLVAHLSQFKGHCTGSQLTAQSRKQSESSPASASESSCSPRLASAAVNVALGTAEQHDDFRALADCHIINGKQDHAESDVKSMSSLSTKSDSGYCNVQHLQEMSASKVETGNSDAAVHALSISSPSISRHQNVERYVESVSSLHIFSFVTRDSSLYQG
jgi:hypothetical protein